MTLFLTYELKVAVLIAVFYIFWRLLVANETWHRLNRIVLLSTALASFVLPLCVITIHQTVEVMPPVADTLPLPTDETAMPMESVPIVTNTETERPFNWLLPLTIIYIIGVVVVLSKMLLSLWRLHRMRAESKVHPLPDGYLMAVCEKVSTPFSWWNTVFMNHNDYEKGAPALLTHELGHLRLHHSADVLLVELLTALQWFNPAMWMLRADLRTIHEFEADQQVISHGFNDIQYLQLLIRKAAGQSGYSLANGISNSALKKRVTMIMKPKSNHRQWLRYAYLLPIVAVSLAMSARIQKDEVLKLDSSVGTAGVMESPTDDNPLILLIDDMDDLKKIVAEKGKTRKMKANLDFNDHFTQNGMNGKTIIVHMPQGSIYENDKGSKKVESDLDYAFPKNGFEWRLNGQPFDENNIPVLHFNMLKKIENHWNGKKNVINLVTISSQPLGEVVTVAKAPTKSEAADYKSEKIFDVVEQMPEFSNGHAALLEYLSKSIRYPEEARKNSIQGRVITTFVVEKDGSISNARVVKSVDSQLDAEALRVINSMPNWNPGKQNGEAVRTKYTVPVTFKLDAATPVEKYVLEIDGKVADDAEIANIPPGDVVSMDVVPAQNGQPKKIVITTKKKK